jgi:hypothetical protein
MALSHLFAMDGHPRHHHLAPPCAFSLATVPLKRCRHSSSSISRHMSHLTLISAYLAPQSPTAPAALHLDVNRHREVTFSPHLYRTVPLPPSSAPAGPGQAASRSGQMKLGARVLAGWRATVLSLVAPLLLLPVDYRPSLEVSYDSGVGNNCNSQMEAGVLGQPKWGLVGGFWCPNKFRVHSRFLPWASIFRYWSSSRGSAGVALMTLQDLAILSPTHFCTYRNTTRVTSTLM